MLGNLAEGQRSVVGVCSDNASQPRKRAKLRRSHPGHDMHNKWEFILRLPSATTPLPRRVRLPSAYIKLRGFVKNSTC
jgi:hypothetical protein